LDDTESGREFPAGSRHTEDLVKRLASVLVIPLLLAACGQLGGIHQRFAAQFRQHVSVSTTAHGSSAKTRHFTTRIKLTSTGPQHVPGGLKILNIAIPSSPAAITWPEWGALVLDKLGAPRCANNLIVMVGWAAQENTQAAWNPLATTYDEPGARLFNSVGVKNYASLGQGLDATVGTLQGGLDTHGYRAIVTNLRACADPLVTAAAINASDWCHGCAGGQYALASVRTVIASYIASLHKR
jgi:hypothetical protein